MTWAKPSTARGSKARSAAESSWGWVWPSWRNSFRDVNDNFENYHIPTITDMPDIETIVVEDPEESGPYGAKGVGEPAVIPTSPAVAAAVGQAVGRPMRHLPISLERVMDALTGESRED